MAVSKRTRFEVLRRDNHTCRYCGGTPPDVKITVDHVTPVALGGSDDPTNLVAACKDCNAGKSSIDPGSELVADVARDARRWSACMEAAAILRSQDRDGRNEYVAGANEAWSRWHIAEGRCAGDELPRPGDWECSVWKFYELLLPIEELSDSIQIAASNSMVAIADKWRYTCGIAWKKLTEMQAVAKLELAESDARVAARAIEYVI